MYKHLEQGWLALSILSVALLAISVVFSFLYIGERPMVDRLMEKIGGEGTISLAPEASQSRAQDTAATERAQN